MAFIIYDFWLDCIFLTKLIFVVWFMTFGSSDSETGIDDILCLCIYWLSGFMRVCKLQMYK